MQGLSVVSLVSILIFCFIMNATPISIPIPVPTRTMNNGLKIPVVGFGTYPLDNSQKTREVLRNAIEIGYRMFDTAFQYDNEKVVGEAIREAIDSGRYKREDFFVVTKIWNTFHSRELVRKQTLMSLKNLGLSYVDLLLMHYPTGYAYPGDDNQKLWFPKHSNGTTIPSSWQKDDYIDTYKGMEDMVRQGFAKSIGVSNFNTYQIDTLLANTQIKPVVNQFECNPFYEQKRLVQHCLKHDIIPEAYSPLHSDLNSDSIIAQIAKKYYKTPTAVALRWLLDRGLILAAKTSNKDRMVQNLNVFDFNLTPTEVSLISNLKDKPKKIDDKGAHTHPDYPFFESMELSESSTRNANIGLLGSMNLLILMIFFYSIACYF